MPKLPGFPLLPFNLPWEGPTPGMGEVPKLEVDPRISSKLQPLLLDEQGAFKEYSEMADMAESTGRFDFAHKFQEMAEDEHKHATYIQWMMRALGQH